MRLTLFFDDELFHSIRSHVYFVRDSHRIGQTKNVKIYRLLTRKTYEMQMFHMSSMKMGLDQAVLQGIENSGGKDIMTKDEVERLLKHGAYDIFKEDKDGEYKHCSFSVLVSCSLNPFVYRHI